MVEHQRVAAWVAEVGHVADAAVHRLAVELHPAGFQLGARGGDIVDVKRDRPSRRAELLPDLGRVDDLDAEGARLELAAVLVAIARGALQAEDLPVEALRAGEARDWQKHEVGALD